MKELFIIVTRMTSGDEFIKYFGNNNWAARYNQNELCIIPSSNDLTYDSNDTICFVDGDAVKNSDEKCNNFKKYIGDGVNNSRQIYMLIHNLNLEEAKQRIFRCNDNVVTIPQNISIAKYSNTLADIMCIVGQLEEAIKETNNDSINRLTTKIKDYIIKKKANPHLIALSILCQGYLAAHGGAGLDGWDKVHQDIKDKAAEKLNDSDDKKNPSKKAWWKTVLEGRKNIEDELDEEQKKDGKIITLLDAIYNNGDLSKVDTVKEAYIDLKSILQGK